MFNAVLDSFMNLDENNKNKVINLISKIINPIKLYLIVVIFLLLIICISNYYICRQFYNFKFQNN